MFSPLRRPARVVAALGLGAAVVAGSTTVAIAASSSPSTSQVLTACAGRGVGYGLSHPALNAAGARRL